MRPLRLLCLGGVESLASHFCLEVARSVVPPPDQDIFQDADGVQTRVQAFLATLTNYVWSNTVYYQQQDVADYFLEGVISSVEAMKTQWKLDTNMPQFTLQIWAMTKVSEVLHSTEARQLDIDKMPKMIRGSVIRNLGKFVKLRKLTFGNSSGDMTIHITKGGSLYSNLCSAVGRMENLVQFTLQYNCTSDILQGNYEKTKYYSYIWNVSA